MTFGMILRKLLRNLGINKFDLFAQFVTGIAGGAIFGMLGFVLVFSRFGLEGPSWLVLFNLTVCVLGTLVAIRITKNYTPRRKLALSFASLILFPLVLSFFAFGPGFEDLNVVGLFLLITITLSLIPSLIITVIINLQRLLNS